MISLKPYLSLLLSFGFITSPSQADSVISFETGDLSQVDSILGQASIVTDDIDLRQGPEYVPNHLPTEGGYMLALDNEGGIDPMEAEEAFGLASGALGSITDRYSAASVTIDGTSGDRVLIDWFPNRDSNGGNPATDFDPVYVFANDQLYLLENNLFPGVFEWQTLEITLQSSGEQAIGFLVGEGSYGLYSIDEQGNPNSGYDTRFGDDDGDRIGYINTRLLIDNIRVETVPTPATATALFVLLPVLSRRRRSATD